VKKEIYSEGVFLSFFEVWTVDEGQWTRMGKEEYGMLTA
jgi:hypothetical protein